MKATKAVLVVLTLATSLLFMAEDDCTSSAPVQSASGLKKVSVKVPVGADGMTAEQRNVGQRLIEDNKPGAIKHLYVISPYSGQVILYSTVKGKVTSGGKRLTPTSVLNAYSNGSQYGGFQVPIGDTTAITGEVLQDDGTYGASGEYLYWWDVRGKYYQIYVNSSVAILISDQPLPIKSVTINVESVGKE